MPIDPEERVPAFMTPPSVADQIVDTQQFLYALGELYNEVKAADLGELHTFLRSNKARKRKWAEQIAHIMDALADVESQS